MTDYVEYDIYTTIIISKSFAKSFALGLEDIDIQVTPSRIVTKRSILLSLGKSLDYFSNNPLREIKLFKSRLSNDSILLDFINWGDIIQLLANHNDL